MHAQQQLSVVTEELHGFSRNQLNQNFLECRYNDYGYFAIIEIHLHRNNIGFNKYFPFVASPSTEMSHITNKVPRLAS